MVKGQLPPADGTPDASGAASGDDRPRSLNRAPTDDLAPWIARLYATVAEAPDDHRVECGLFNDTTVIRIQLKGAWEAETREGPRKLGRAAVVFGPQSRLMPVAVTGGFISVGISLRPGTGYALRRFITSDFVDRLVPSEEFGLAGEQALALLERHRHAANWLNDLEQMCREVIAGSGGREPDPVSAKFEVLAATDPTVSVADFARSCGIDLRRLERIVRRDFGLPPKQVLRRARALDMASSLRGVADRDEAEALVLRFYDQSHLIREFTDLFGMSPRQFAAKPMPILTRALESRQARRLELLERLAPDQSRPWE